jgi:DNA-binding response OmpR family regulator
VSKVSPRVVLVVDDDDIVRRVVRTVLEADDFQVVEAASGREALDAIAEEHPMVMVLDVMMPGMDGVEVLKQLDAGSVKVLMLTARDDVATEEASRAAGAVDFLAKPFSSVELLEHVEKLAEGD